MNAALWLLHDTGWRLYAHTPLLRYCAGALRHRSLSSLLVWLRDRLWTRQSSAWLDRPGPRGWLWEADHPAWLEGVVLYLAPHSPPDPPPLTQHLRLWHDLPTPIPAGHGVSVVHHPGQLSVDLGDEAAHVHPLPEPVRLLAIEVQYRRRLP